MTKQEYCQGMTKLAEDWAQHGEEYRKTYTRMAITPCVMIVLLAFAAICLDNPFCLIGSPILLWNIIRFGQSAKDVQKRALEQRQDVLNKRDQGAREYDQFSE